nr:hypothetical protein [uncultured Cupriavidus sp.]
MSGGRIAISGFDYQAVVILDQLFDHFDQHASDARARPEGADDLDLLWTESGRDCCRHVQVKKPRETDKSMPKRQPWRLSEVAEELLPDTLDRLAVSNSQQTWILGDAVQPQVRRLIAAGNTAANQEADLYWSVVHLMARAAILDQIPGGQRRLLLKWRFENPPNIANDARDFLIASYGQRLSAANVGAEITSRYSTQVTWIAEHLPDVLARVEILDNYGSEAEVGQRFRERLQREYGLSSEVVVDNLFGNFRSFINDVAKRPGEQIDRRSFEVQLRSAWPQMSAATAPPTPPEKGILRPDLTDALVKPGVAAVIEVVGISGSGKTTLAAQSAASLANYDPGRIPIYVRVRENAAFRDVMSGISFYLLRQGIPDLFGLAVLSKPADDTVIHRLAEICSGLSQRVQLMLDLVDGASNAQFGRDLGRFARALTPGSCRLVVFGQQSAFSALSPVEASSAGIVVVNMRGFRREEFITLVGHYHAGADRNVLWDVYSRVTVGRQAGLYAKLAEALARQPSLDAMVAIAGKPPQDMISAAEQNRFGRLPPGVRDAAERLVCFSLPYRRQDAEAAFPDENVSAAIKALVDLGLLRTETDGLLEMHETVRAGLESGIASAVRQSAHVTLAKWYSGLGDIAAQIFHLDKAGRSAEADILARETFLAGDAWGSLASYVTRKELVTAQEIVAAAGQPGRIADFYLLPFILEECAPDDDSSLMNMLVQQRPRYFGDYDWMHHVVKAILALNPSRFQELLVFTVCQSANAEERRQALTWLLTAARNGRRSSALEIVDFAKSQPEDVQRLLLPALLQAGGRAALTLAFDIFARPTDKKADRYPFWRGVKLTVERYEDVVEILAALPKKPVRMMIAIGSLAFGPIGSLIWAARHQLRPFCVAILKSKDGEVEIKATAWRVLIFIGYPALETLVDPLAPDPVPQDYALLGPAFSPTAYDVGRYEQLLFDLVAPSSSRQAALTVLLLLGADLGALRSRLAYLRDDPLASHWDALFMLVFVKHPFAAGVPLLRAELASSSATTLPPGFLVPCLITVSEAEWPDVTDLLMEGVQHSDLAIRSASAAGLVCRRSLRAREVLRQRIAVEPDPQIVNLLARALSASGPTSAKDLVTAFASPDIDLWQCIIAMRTRDEGFAPQLVKFATNSSANWIVRRAAIWAAGRLPFSAALQMIAPQVLAESSPLTIDSDESLQAHGSIIGLLENGASRLLHKGEAKFVEGIASILEEQWSDLIAPGSLPSPIDAARWLYTSLMDEPSPRGVLRLLNGVRVPLLHAAVARSFRHCGRPQYIEDVLASTSSVWLAVKCLQELRSVRVNDPDLGQRLRRILATSPCGSAPLLDRIVAEMEEGQRQSGTIRVAPSAPIGPSVRPTSQLLDYSEAVRALRGTPDIGVDTGQPLALSRLEREEVQKLIALADPANDPQSSVVRFTPMMTFTAKGHMVAQESSTSTGSTPISARLRPAIAAANRFDLPMPWHNDRLRWPWIDTYGPQFIASIGAQGDADRLYQALDSDADILLPFLGRPEGLKATELLLNEKLAPILHRYVLMGDDAFFESLCNLVQRVESPAAVPILSGLLGRWASHTGSPRSANIELSRGFVRLREHPRFRDVPGWRRTLENALDANMWWFDRQDIFRILEGDPGSYVIVESQLVREENWAHFRRSEIDSLDEAAERLFHETH